MDLQNVAVGIVPFSSQRTIWPMPTFTIFDDARAHADTLDAASTLTHPGQVELYARAFDRLSQVSARGAAARSLVMSALSFARLTADRLRKRPACVFAPGSCLAQRPPRAVSSGHPGTEQGGRGLRGMGGDHLQGAGECAIGANNPEKPGSNERMAKSALRLACSVSLTRVKCYFVTRGA
ncbi:Scr1 family TA system antitoxin-like transcriptional regulator [Streptomyces sp. MMG1121]|uniref:Scr1 family TA system antitoxin-like transcriptional regulator n=1 Tax=Streptomyces sp. MMG1121 TaxID=1415544 RepID=UPI000A5FA1CF|nr:Scr1 family TA system antitoxin-like transcriptional regulator [Streptomyces sp. MMG1121]